jgi:nucleotide-binding universal stress UspA family protein
VSYRSILVNLDIDGPIIPIVRAATGLAERLEAKLIGFCAADAPLPLAGPGGEALVAEAWQQMRKDIENRCKALHEEFGKLTAGTVQTEWRAATDNPTPALANASRAADLIVMSARKGVATGGAYRVADPGSLVLQAGRPLLIVGAGTEQVASKKIVVAWKDTREARRAVADAVPLLQAADEVTVVTVAPEAEQRLRDGIADTAAFLVRHGIKARTEFVESSGDSDRLVEFIGSHRPDLVVSGAYGHSRLREWAFGGVTRSLLDESGLNRFMSN